MKLSSEPGPDISQRATSNTDGGIKRGSPKFFRTANYKSEDRDFQLSHNTPIPRKSRVELKKPKLEFVEQLLTDINSSDAPILISYKKDHTIDILTFEGELICELMGHDANVTAAKALSDKMVVTGDASGVLIVWDLTQIEGENTERKSSKKAELSARHLLKRFHEHTDAITAIEAINGQNFVSASLDCSYRYWHINHDKSIQAIESSPKKPILSLTLLSEDVLLYCVERFESKYRRSDPLHTIIDQPNFSVSSFLGTITHIKLMPDGYLAFIDQMKNSGTVITRHKNVSLYGESPARILSNGRFAFMGEKRNVVVEQFPLIETPMLSVGATEIEKEKRTAVSLF
jgi:hypothetical protein